MSGATQESGSVQSFNCSRSLALGIVSLVQERTNAMVGLPTGLRPALTMPAVETVALRKSVTVTRHVAVRHRVTYRVVTRQ